jgi:PLD-like domain
MANPGDTLQHRVVPMIGPDKNSLRPDTATASDWTDAIELTHEVEPKIEVYFNRGIVAAQWVARRLNSNDLKIQAKKLSKVIDTPLDPFREYLAGPLGVRLFELLESAAKERRDIYAALYELDDNGLEPALAKLGERAHVVLANGSVKKKGADQNKRARANLKAKIDLHNRMVSPRALGHNKFLVICEKQGTPRWVWTGSQNWTKTGLCTQANNSVLIDDSKLAMEYREQWDFLKNAGNETPQTLKTDNSTARDEKPGGTPDRLWFTPTIGQVDLEQSRKIILGAKQAILFLMFNPGPNGTLLNSIIEKARQGTAGKRLYIHGAINQDPSTTKNPVELFDQQNSQKADFETVLPAAIDDVTTFWVKELRKLPKAFAMVHSKVVLIDPFSDHPVLLTGSHNLGPKASGTNDENLLIIRDAPGLSAAYATNIMSVNPFRGSLIDRAVDQQEGMNFLKEYCVLANEEYAMVRKQEHQKELETRRAALRASVAEREARRRVLDKMQI